MTTTKQKKNSKIRHLEYYDLQNTLDTLYADSGRGKIFNNLMPLIESEENIRLAYRNIKRNSGSNTRGVDRLTIKDIEKIPETKFVEIVRKKLQWYKPKAVRRVEIPKPNGKLRPLGIPAIWDRIVQQCILQILEPICEAKFSDRSNGFRPNRSAEHAIAQAYALMQKSHLHFVVDIDIKGFFDNVNHSKLIKQMWNMLKNVNNPQAMLSQMMQSNPNFKQAQEQVNELAKKYDGDYKKAFFAKAKEMGVNPDDLINTFK